MSGVARLRVDGIDLAYDSEGSGPPLLLVHGLEGSRHVWGDILAPLVSGHTVIRPDLRGHGESGGPLDPGGYRAENLATDLIRLVEALGLEDVVAVAHSFGGTCTMLAAIESPDTFSGMVLVNTWTFGMPREARQKPLEYLDAISRRGIVGIYDMTPAVRRNHPTEGPRYDEPSFAAARREERERVRPEAYVAIAEQMLERPSFHAALENLRIPTLLLASEGDHAMRVPMEALHDLLKGSEYAWLPDSGHNPMFDVPDLLAGHILEFARSVQNDPSDR